MELEDIPIPPTPPSSSAGASTSTEDGGGGGTVAVDAWQKAKQALQQISDSSGKGKMQESMSEYPGGVYNPYMQPYQWGYPTGYGMMPPAAPGSYPPQWAHCESAGWGQPATAGGFQRFGFSSAPTQVGTAALSASSTPSSSTDHSSSESPSSASFRSGFPGQSSTHSVRPSAPVTRAGLGFRPSRGHIRFDIGRNRGALETAPNRFLSSQSYPSGFAGSSDVDEHSASDDREQQQFGGTAASPTKHSSEMPDAMKAYIDRAYAAAETSEKKNQVEQTLKHRLASLLKSGEAWQMDWEKEPLPTDTDFALRLLKSNMQSRGRGSAFPMGPRFLSPRGNRGIGGGPTAGRFQSPGQQAFPTSPTTSPEQQRQPHFAANRARGSRFAKRTLLSRGAARLPPLSRSRSKSRSRSRSGRSRSRSNSSENASKKSSDSRYRRRRESRSPSYDLRGKRRRDSANGRRASSSSGVSEQSIIYFDTTGKKKKQTMAARKRNNKRQRKRYSKEDVDNDDHESNEDDGGLAANRSVPLQSAALTKGGKKQKKKAMKFTLGKGQPTPEQEAMKRQRALRFAKHIQPHAPTTASKSVASRLGKRLGIPYKDSGGDGFFEDRNLEGSDDLGFDLTAFKVIGTCQSLEKQYFRLTTAPDPSQVRPEPVLVESLALVKRKWKEKGDYYYACDQLKSIRQDMTIQCIRNRFTVDVYETHARIALEKADREEFNQCQSQLKALYAELPGCQNEFEFTAYRLLFYVYMENTMDLTTILSNLTPAMFRDECIAFALKIRRAWSLKNYHKFFKLAAVGKPPRMCAYVLELCMERERKRALKTVVTAFRPWVPVSWITQELAFEMEEDCLEFLGRLQVQFIEDDESKVDCRQPLPTV